MKLTKKNSGFTLVELSIALVIVGLLIGGILVGQSLISSAKINKAVAQIQEFDAAVATFKAEYLALPGDSTVFGGNGDKILTMANPVTPAETNAAIFGGEIKNFWNSVDSSKFPGTPGTPENASIAPVSSGTNQSVPLSKMGKTGSFIVASALTSVGGLYCYADTTNKQNYYSIMGPTQAQTNKGHYYFDETTASNSAVTPADALAFDQKIDDGVANDGEVLSGGIPNGWDHNGGIWTAPGTGICSNGVNYLVDKPGYECTPVIRIGAQTGELL